MSIIEFEGVSKRYDDVLAVDNVSFSLEPGQLLVLLGASGCGKTTTLRLIAGLEAPNSGTIYLNGRGVAGGGQWVPPDERRVGVVFQDYALFPHLSVLANVAFGLNRVSGAEQRRRVAEMLALVGLPGLGQRYPHQLSGGQQQRVAIARALAPGPDILLLDEPFSNLDTALRTQVRAEVRDILRRTQTTAVFVTHDQEEALSLADQVAVMFDGRIEQIGTPQQVYQRPASRRVAAFVGESNFVAGEAHGAAVDCVLGQLPLTEPANGPVEVLLRPEALRLDDGDGCAARVDWVEFYGHNQRIGLTLESGVKLVARSDTDRTYTPGTAVRVGVQGAVRIFET